MYLKPKEIETLIELLDKQVNQASADGWAALEEHFHNTRMHLARAWLELNIPPRKKQ